MIDDVLVAPGIPEPPPPRGSAAAGHDYSTSVLKLWEQVLFAGGELPEADLRVYSANNSPHEYLRYHPEATERDAQRHADSWMHRRMLEQAVARGWLIRDGEMLRLGTQPGQHQPLSGLTPEPERRELLLMARTLDRLMPNITEADARRLLMAKGKSSKVRLRSSAMHRHDLEASLRTAGQVNPVLLWRGRPEDEPIVIDGQNRLDILAKLGIEPKVFWLDPATSPRLLLFWRLVAEFQTGAKKPTEKEMEKFVEGLAEQGLIYEAIGEIVGLSRNRVNEIQVAAGTYRKRTLADMEPEVRAEIIGLAKKGWSQDDIAARTGWSQMSVSRLLAEARSETSPETSSQSDATAERQIETAGAPTLLRAGKKPEMLVRALLAIGDWANQTEAFDRAGIDAAGRSGNTFIDLVAKGWVEVREEERKEYRATEQAATYYEPLPEMAVTPVTEPTVTPVTEPVRPRAADWLDEALAEIVAKCGLDLLVERVLRLQRGAA